MMGWSGGGAETKLSRRATNSASRYSTSLFFFPAQKESSNSSWFCHVCLPRTGLYLPLNRPGGVGGGGKAAGEADGEDERGRETQFVGDY